MYRDTFISSLEFFPLLNPVVKIDDMACLALHDEKWDDGSGCYKKTRAVKYYRCFKIKTNYTYYIDANRWSNAHKAVARVYLSDL